MTYNVFGGTLSLTQSINQSSVAIANHSSRQQPHVVCRVQLRLTVLHHKPCWKLALVIDDRGYKDTAVLNYSFWSQRLSFQYCMLLYILRVVSDADSLTSVCERIMHIFNLEMQWK